MVKTPAVVLEEHPFVLSSLPPGPAQKRLALAVVVALPIVFFVSAGPLATFQPAHIHAFVPAYAAAMFVTDSITAILLFAQFSILRSRALLVIANGYLFTALIAIPWMLTFPGVFAPSGLLGGGLASTNWLYILWHGGFSIFVIVYTLLKDADPAKQLWPGSAGAAILSSVAMTATVVCVVVFLVTTYDPLLPQLMLDSGRPSGLWYYAAGSMGVLIILALIVLWVRRRSVLDLWLMVVMCAYVCRGLFSTLQRRLVCRPGLRGPVRQSRPVCPAVRDNDTLRAVAPRRCKPQRREREARLMTGDAVAATIAHEVKQPLSGMIANADAGLRWLDRAMPDLDEAKAAFKEIVADGHRAGAVIESIRTIFKKGASNRTSLDVNKLIAEVLALACDNLQKHRILVQAEPNAQAPQVIGDRIQLRQVLLNLITNAIEFDGGGGQGWGAGPEREVRSRRGWERNRIGGGHRNRDRLARNQADIQPAVHHKARRYGDGSVDMPFDR